MKIDRTKTEVLTDLVRKDILEHQALDVLTALEELGILTFLVEEPKTLAAVVRTRRSDSRSSVFGEDWVRWTASKTEETPWIGACTGERRSWAGVQDLRVEKVTHKGCTS